MAQTPSNMLALGTIAPGFKLLNVVDNNYVSLKNLKGEKATVILFICNHCPFVKHLNAAISKTAKMYVSRGVNFIAISSNDVKNYPLDAPELMKELVKNEDFIFPYLYDKDQEVARAYDAACTPDFYVFNKKLTLEYRGQFDDSRPGNNIPVTGKDLVAAINAILNNQAVNPDQKPSIGCNIKWLK